MVILRECFKTGIFLSIQDIVIVSYVYSIRLTSLETSKYGSVVDCPKVN